MITIYINGLLFNDNEVNYITMIQRTIYLLFTTTYQCYTKCTTSLSFSLVFLFKSLITQFTKRRSFARHLNST